MSFHKETIGLIEGAIAKEYENAIAVDEKLHKGRCYNTLHEGYGVLLEEMFETQNALNGLGDGNQILLGLLHIRDVKRISITLHDKITKAEDAMAELAQVAAVCKKMLDTIEKYYEDGEE